jgi:hypothetical protein
MTHEDKQAQPRELHRDADVRISTEDLLIEQYRILESRRNYFGRLFWQVPVFIVTILTIVISHATEIRSMVLAIVLLMGAFVLLLAAYIDYSLMKSQKECKLMLGSLEDRFHRDSKLKPMSLPSDIYGVQFYILIFLVFFAILLAFFAVEVFLQVQSGAVPTSGERLFF